MIIDILSVLINPYNFNNVLITQKDITSILSKYDIHLEPNNLDLYQNAFVHKSYTKKNPELTCMKVLKKLVASPEKQPTFLYQSRLDQLYRLRQKKSFLYRNHYHYRKDQD